MNMSAVT